MSNYQGKWTYEGLTEYIAGGRNKHSRTVANNTDAYLADRGDSVVIYLHGNLIARLTKKGRMEFTLAGWNSNTTRQRLNMMMPRGSGVRTKQGDAYLITQSGDVRLADTRLFFEVNEHGRLVTVGS